MVIQSIYTKCYVVPKTIELLTANTEQLKPPDSLSLTYT